MFARNVSLESNSFRSTSEGRGGADIDNRAAAAAVAVTMTLRASVSSHLRIAKGQEEMLELI